MQYNEDISDVLVADIGEERSSFIKRLEYDERSKVLTVFFRRYYVTHLSYANVDKKYFEELIVAYSIGRFYNLVIKPSFKTINNFIMADRPPTKNEASDQKRFIKMSINVQEINKAWLVAGKSGTYLNMTLQMLPDGTMDRFGNLGMITQDTPKSLYEKEKNLKKEDRTRGAILGNACEFDDAGPREGMPGDNSGQMVGDNKEIADDLPF